MSEDLETESGQPSWELWRQDDNGVKVLVARYKDRDEALARVEKFESSQHKQTYWIEKRPLAIPKDQARSPSDAP